MPESHCPREFINVLRRDIVKNGVATIVTETGVEREVEVDAIVNAQDMLPNTELVDGISVSEVYTIGDCAAPFNIGLAIRGGNDAGRAI